MKNMKNPNLSVMLELEVKDRNGNIVKRHIQVSKSLLKNFAKFLRLMLSAYSTGGGSYQVTGTFTDVNNQSKTVYGAYATGAAAGGYVCGLVPLMANAPSGVDDCGIVVGTSSQAVSRDDYALIGKIPNGSSSDQLAYGSMTVEDVDGTPPDTIFRLIRTYTNNTDNAITVREIGIYVKNNQIWNNSPTIVTLCIARDVLSEPMTVDPLATLTVRYVFKVTA